MIIERFFLFLTETIRCDPSSESSRRNDSDEGSQLVFIQNKQKLVERLERLRHGAECCHKARV